MRKTVEIEGYKVDCVTREGFVERVVAAAKSGNGGWVWTPNVDMFRHCKENRALAEFIHEPDIVIADGMPLVWASYLQGTPLPERVAGSTTVWMVAEAAAKHGLTTFYLGGGEVDTAIRTAEILSDLYPGLKVVGTHYPPFGFEKDEAEIEAMVTAINEAQPDIIFFALSFPKGEFLVKRIKDRCPPALWMGVGISFSFITEDVKRAPRWVRLLGMEWFHRMMQEPKRLYKRYLLHDIPFVIGMLGRSFMKRFQR